MEIEGLWELLLKGSQRQINSKGRPTGSPLQITIYYLLPLRVAPTDYYLLLTVFTGRPYG
jgi:hypothetical protein